MTNLVSILGIKIDPSAARAGASAVSRILDDLKRRGGAAVKGISKDFDSLKNDLFSIKGALVGITTGLAAMTFKNIMREGALFEQSVADLSAITGAVGNDLDFLSLKSQEFAAVTTLSAIDVVEAFKLVASAKPDLLTNKDALAAVTKEAIALAEAAGVTVPNAANVLGLSLNQFGEAADQASRYVNVLAAGAKLGASEVEDTSEAIKNSGVVAKSMGLTFEELNAAIQILAASGVKGGEAGTQLRGVLLNAGLAADKLSPKVVGIAKALDNMALELDTVAKQEEVFGKINIAAGQILIENRDQLVDLITALTGTNVAYEQKAVRVDTLQADLKILSNVTSNLKIQFADYLNPAVRDTTQVLTDFIKTASENFIEVKVAGGRKGQGTFINFLIYRGGIEISFNAIDRIISGSMNLWRRGIANLSEVAATIWESMATTDWERNWIISLKNVADGYRGAITSVKDFDGIQNDIQERTSANIQGVVENTQELIDGYYQQDAAQKNLIKSQEVLGEAVASTAGEVRKYSESMDEANKRTKELTDLAAKIKEDIKTPFEIWQEQLNDVNDLLKRNMLTEAEASRARLMYNKEYADSFDKIKEKTEEVDDVAKELGMTFSSAFEDAVVEGNSFRNVLDGIAKDLIRLTLRKSITEPFADWFSKGDFLNKAIGFGMSLFGGGGNTMEGSLAMPGAENLFANVAHGGGIVGSLSSGRMVNAGIFSHADRYHGGGIVGDEEPIIARKKEGIFTEGQMKAMGKKENNIDMTNNFYVNSDNGKISIQSQQQIAAKFGSIINRAVTRSN